MKVSIDSAKCIGCGACVVIANDIFNLDQEKGAAVVVKQPDNNHQGVKQAAESCPVSAIIISNKETTDE